MRVAFVPRSAEIQPLFSRFVNSITLLSSYHILREGLPFESLNLLSALSSFFSLLVISTHLSGKDLGK
jgi:hypothetical protein